ncbi:hypothetical protein PMAYCL1PPCAC_20613, partial [Pristionchus mayeri]
FSNLFISNGRSLRQLLLSYHPSHRSVDGQGMRWSALPQHPSHLPRILPWSDSRLLYHQRQSPSPPLNALLEFCSLQLLRTLIRVPSLNYFQLYFNNPSRICSGQINVSI